jgi:hypothetical protein
VALDQVITRVRIFAHKVFRVKELAERRYASSVDHAGLEVEEHCARYAFAARGLVVKHVDAAELRVAVAAVLAFATDTALAANHLLKLGAHLATALARLHVRNLARRSSLRRGARREKREGGSGET